MGMRTFIFTHYVK